MLKRISVFIISFAVFLTSGCSPKVSSFKKEYFDVFDTYTVFQAYAQSREEFDIYAEIIYAELFRLHQLFNIYEDYDGINNIKTINDNAGIAPISVDLSVIRLIELGLDAYNMSDGKVNIAMGSVLSLWHDCRAYGIEHPEHSRLPLTNELYAASLHCNIDDVIIDKSAGTVYLADPHMSLDPGALAKGYAVQKAAELAADKGLASGFISAGGNVKTIGAPQDGRDFWSVGIQSPEAYALRTETFDTIHIADMSVVTSGNYERFYTVNGTSYHHIINPDTLMPAYGFKSVSVLHEDSSVAEMLSTPLFLLSYEAGFELLQEYGADGLWIFDDGMAVATDGYKAVSSIDKW